MNFFKGVIWGILLNALVLFLIVNVVEGVSYTGGVTFFVISSLVLAIINSVFKPFIKLLSLPFVVLTGGLFLVVINMFVLWFLSYFLSVIQFRDVTLTFKGIVTYIIAAVVFGLANWILHLFFKR